MTMIDCDQHLVETPRLWLDHIDPAARDEALRIDRDDAGYWWLWWRGRRIYTVDPREPGDLDAVGRVRERVRSGLPPEDDATPDDWPDDAWDPAARVSKLGELGVDEAVVFPNFALFWEWPLRDAPAAQMANMGAWNRWCADVVVDSGGRLHPVGHVTLCDPRWLSEQLRALGAAGVRLAMVPPGLVDGRPMSHPDHDPMWRAFVEHGVTPVFHVADQQRPFAVGWYREPDELTYQPVLESVFPWAAAALACTDLVLGGVLERHPDLRLGLFEVSAVWVPMWLMMLDGGFDFARRLNGRAVPELADRPSNYFRRQARVAAFAFEQPARLVAQSDDIYMACSDYPHTEGTRTPLPDYAARSNRTQLEPGSAPKLFRENIEFLLGR